MAENQQALHEIKTERDYAIRKGKVIERFSEAFCERFKYSGLYRECYELLIRDADPYNIIEKLIEINHEQYQQINKLLEFAKPGTINL